MNFEVMTLDESSRDLGILYFCRGHSQIADLLLRSSSFEPGMLHVHRYNAAISLESEFIGGYVVVNVLNGQEILAKTSFTLGLGHLSNPCLCISFFTAYGQGTPPKLVTLLCMYEFQHVVGCFVHQENTFLLYRTGSAQEARRRLKDEYLESLISELINHSSKGDLEKTVRLGPSSHAIATGFNNNFGHALWNDAIGLLNRRALLNSLQKSYADGLMVGPKQWIVPDLFDHPVRQSFISFHLATSFMISERVTIHSPIGFTQGIDYDNFMKYEVASLASNKVVSRLRHLRSRHWPIISFGVRWYDQKRQAWNRRNDQIKGLIYAITLAYPNAAFVFDGLTSFWNDMQVDKLSVQESIGNIMSNFPMTKSMHISGEALETKIATYKIIDFHIGQFGSGQAIPHWIYRIPSLTICGDNTLIKTYSDPEHVIRLAMPALSSHKHCFMPAEFISGDDSAFELLFPEAANFVVEKIQNFLQQSYFDFRS